MIGHRWQPNKELMERLRAEQRARFTCGVDGCAFTFVGRIDEWLEVRAEHRRMAHPAFVAPRRKLVSFTGKVTGEMAA